MVPLAPQCQSILSWVSLALRTVSVICVSPCLTDPFILPSTQPTGTLRTHTPHTPLTHSLRTHTRSLAYFAHSAKT